MTATELAHIVHGDLEISKRRPMTLGQAIAALKRLQHPNPKVPLYVQNSRSWHRIKEWMES